MIICTLFPCLCFCAFVGRQLIIVKPLLQITIRNISTHAAKTRYCGTMSATSCCRRVLGAERYCSAEGYCGTMSATSCCRRISRAKSIVLPKSIAARRPRHRAAEGYCEPNGIVQLKGIAAERHQGVPRSSKTYQGELRSTK